MANATRPTNLDIKLQNLQRLKMRLRGRTRPLFRTSAQLRDIHDTVLKPVIMNPTLDTRLRVEAVSVEKLLAKRLGELEAHEQRVVEVAPMMKERAPILDKIARRAQELFEEKLDQFLQRRTEINRQKDTASKELLAARLAKAKIPEVVAELSAEQTAQKAEIVATVTKEMEGKKDKEIKQTLAARLAEAEIPMVEEDLSPGQVAERTKITEAVNKEIDEKHAKALADLDNEIDQARRKAAETAAKENKKALADVQKKIDALPNFKKLIAVKQTEFEGTALAKAEKAIRHITGKAARKPMTKAVKWALFTAQASISAATVVLLGGWAAGALSLSLPVAIGGALAISLIIPPGLYITRRKLSDPARGVQPKKPISILKTASLYAPAQILFSVATFAYAGAAAVAFFSLPHSAAVLIPIGLAISLSPTLFLIGRRISLRVRRARARRPLKKLYNNESSQAVLAELLYTKSAPVQSMVQTILGQAIEKPKVEKVEEEEKPEPPPPPPPLDPLPPRPDKTEPPSAEVDVLGTELASFALGEEIGSGGFGVVRLATGVFGFEGLFAAKKISLDRLIEMLAPPFAKDGSEHAQLVAEMLIRGQIEYEAATKVASRHICRAVSTDLYVQFPDLKEAGKHDSFRQGFTVAAAKGRTYTIVYEFVPEEPGSAKGARSLKEIIDETRGLSEARAQALLIPAMEALVEQHEAGFSHRDLKPDNLLAPKDEHKDEHLKVIDFGAARDENQNTRHTQLSQPNTPNYKPPEGYYAEGVGSFLIDVFQFGVIITECLIGGNPFAAMDTITKAKFAAGEVRVVLPEGAVKSSLKPVLERMMSKEPAHNYASLKEATAALKSAFSAKGAPVEDPTSVARSKPAVAEKPVAPPRPKSPYPTFSEETAAREYLDQIVFGEVTFEPTEKRAVLAHLNEIGSAFSGLDAEVDQAMDMVRETSTEGAEG
ncbi:protein kinase [Candidatus Margulisiibacteriota bacterium]